MHAFRKIFLLRAGCERVSDRTWTRRVRWLVLLAIIAVPTLFVTGARGSVAVQLATGFGIPALQREIDRLQNKAIRKQPFTEQDKQMLRELYGAMADGARLSGVLGQSGRLMDHYLGCTGTPLELDPGIFVTNQRVQQPMNLMRAQIRAAATAHARLEPSYRSPRFYMPHASSPDSVTGLYWGTVQATPQVQDDGTVRVRWRAEVPWEWPTYESLQLRYGTPHAEIFPIPNARSLLYGPQYALHVENGLGGYLVTLGLAKPFLAWSEWEEAVERLDGIPGRGQNVLPRAKPILSE
jgi:hypothetical protein